MKINIKLNLFLFLILLGVGFFGFNRFVLAQDLTLVISEVSQNFGGVDNEFVEIYNYGENEINLHDLGIKLKLINSSNEAISKDITWKNTIILAKDYFLFGSKEMSGNIDAFFSASLDSTKDGVMITDKKDNILDRVTWEKLDKNKSLEKIENNFEIDNNESFFLQNNPNPQNSFYEEEDEEEEEEPEPEPEPEEPVDYSGQIIINEIFPYSESEDDEFVELKNIGENEIDLVGWKITDNANHKYEFLENSKIEPSGIIYVKRKLYLNNDFDIVYLFDNLTDTADKSKAFDTVEYAGAKKEYSYSFDGANWYWTSVETKGTENKFDEIENSNEDEESEKENNFEKSKYKIRLNEILPNPKGEESEKEYVEIFSDEEEEINLEDWKIKDSSTKKFTFSDDYIIKPKEYLVIYRDKFKFALNNTGGESVYLFDEKGHLASNVSYSQSAKENVSYNLDSNDWRWSKKLTPGKKNEFSSVPKIKIEKIKSGFVGIPIYFSAKVDYKKKKDLKYRWDFGDDRKSYLKDTSHTFLKKGKYKIIFSVDNGVEEIAKSFSIEIKKYPKADVEIVSLLPNPVGNDEENEWIEVRNNSRKKVNLKVWKIATGEKTLINHPIYEDFFVAPNEITKITRKNSLFYLNNKQATVELRYPDGKLADKVKYKKDKISEGEICQNVKGECIWILSQKEEEIAEEKIVREEIVEEVSSEILQVENLLKKEINQKKLIHFSFQKEFSIKTVVKKIPIYQIENEYHFTRPNNRPHWASELLDEIETEIFSFFI